MSVDTPPNELAAKWAELLADRELTETEAAELHDWLLADPTHGDMLADACFVVTAFRTMPAGKRAEILAFLEDSSSPVSDSSAPTSTNSRPRWRLYGAAACAVFATVLGILWFSQGSIFPQTYRTRTAETRTVQFPDGSLAHLNAKTTVRWSGFTRERRAQLVDGQALFEVVHDAEHPFYVEADSALVRVLGTKFDLHRRSDRIILTVLEGAVDIRSNDPYAAGAWQRVVRADQRIAYGRSGLLEDVRQVDADKATRWRAFSLELENEPLSAVIEDLSRYTDQPIRLGNARLNTQRVFGLLQVRDIHEALRDLEEIAPVIVRQDAATFVLDLRLSTVSSAKQLAEPRSSRPLPRESTMEK